MLIFKIVDILWPKYIEINLYSISSYISTIGMLFRIEMDPSDSFS